jgi:phosphatidylethanolamine-binding protein (PEBP) family uncharacterized protein
MEIKYNNKIVTDDPKVNEPIFLTTKETQIKPVISLKGLDDNKYYTLIMYDPNAVGGNYVHWIVINIKGNDFNTGNHFFEYYGPHPPKNSGKHNYIFSLYMSEKDIMKDLDLDPNKRQMELKYLLNKLNITGKPIYTKQFISEYQDGGKCKRKYTKKSGHLPLERCLVSQQALKKRKNKKKITRKRRKH